MERMESQPKPDRPPRRVERGDRLSFLVQTAALLFLCAAGAGYILVDRSLLRSPQEYAIFLGPPASASLLFVAAGVGFPHLLSPGRLAFPLNLTLPIVFPMLIRVSVILWASPSSAVFRAFDPLMPALSWTNAGPLALSALIQAIVLSVFVVAGNR